MFDYLKTPRDLTQYSLMTGVTDFGNLVQFNMYETGYAALICIKIPRFLEKLASTQEGSKYAALINNYKHIIEREFKSLDGLEDIGSDPLEITDGISTIEVTGKVTMQSASTFSMRYQEKSGSPITRLHELFLRGIRDPRGGQVKHYHGLIDKGLIEPGFENETFTFLYINTDNTMRNIEKAYLIVGAQPTGAKTSIYNYEKGNIEFQDVDVEFRGFPITSNEVDKKAKQYLDWLHNPKNPDRIIVDSSDFKYTGVSDLNPKVDN